MTLDTKSLHEIDKEHYLPTFRRYPLAFERGQGARLWDVEGNQYIDALAGIAVVNVGHSHPRLVDAINKQAEKLIHISNFYVSEPQMLLAKRLAELSGLERVFFGNSGAEAAEGAIKIARKYASKHGRGGTIMTMQNAFHGRTLATVAATGKKAMMQGFEPIPTGFCHVPFNNIDMIKEKVNKDVAGIMVEPIQGEGGINPADPVFLRELRAFCNEQNLVLIFDEIQCGIARTGRMFAHEHYGVKPDVMTLAKALGGGVPVGAVLASERVGGAIDWGDHGTTFGGNPLASAAALAVLDIIEEDRLLAAAETKGNWIKSTVENAKPGFPEIREVRGEGLMIGIELTIESKPVVVGMMNKGVLANATAGHVVRLVPPLVITDEELEKVMHAFFETLKELRNG